MTAASAAYPAGIKSIQTGTITLTAVTSNTATITSVNTAKAFCIFNGGVSSAAESNSYAAQLTNATTVTAYRSASGNTTTVYYTVVEFN